MRVDMFLWPRREPRSHGDSSQTRRISTTNNGFSLLSYDASARRTAFSMSFGAYSGLAMQELVHRNWKEFMIAPKTASSGKAEQYVVPSDI